MPPPLSTAASDCVEMRIASAIRFPMAASPVRTVALRLSSSTAVVPIGRGALLGGMLAHGPRDDALSTVIYVRALPLERR